MNYSILHNEAKLAEHFLPYQLAWIGVEDGIHALRKQRLPWPNSDKVLPREAAMLWSDDPSIWRRWK